VDPALRDLVATGPLCHLTTLNVRNRERDPRVALSFLGPHEEGAFLQPYAVEKVGGNGPWAA